MKYSLKWLNDYCATSLPPEELAQIVTDLGLEVENIDEHGYDYILDIDVTPDMAHCLSMIGLAGEIAAGTDQPLTLPVSEYKEEKRDDPGIEVIVDDPDLCPLYVARVVEDVKIGPGPVWMGERLEAAGMRPLDVVVDVTNYVMLETGQPLHAFDKAKLKGGKIIVRRARENELITLLDGSELKLCTDDLVIADAERPIAIAGVMGGLGSEIDDSTKDLVLEIAYFEPTSVRRTAKRYGLATESSYRFERGTNPDGVIAASDRAVALFTELAGGKVIDPMAASGETEWPMAEISLRPNRVNLVLGTDLSSDGICDTLRSIYFEAEPTRNGDINVKPPGYRRDVTREIDLIEEVGRVYGYNRIESTLPTGEFLPPFHIEREEVFGKIKEVLTGSGFFEAYTNGFTDEEHLDKYGVSGNAVGLLNPISSNMTHLRNAIWPMLAEIADSNARYGQPGALFFELGTIFYAANKAKLELYDVEHDGVGEEVHLGIIGGGQYGDYHWQGALAKIDFFFIKGILDDLAGALNLPGPEFRDGKISMGPLSGEYRSVKIENLPDKLIAVELDITSLLKTGIKPISSLKSVPRFPGVERDLALLVDRSVPAEELIDAVRESDPNLIEVGIFDMYQGKGIPSGKKSIGIRLRYRAEERTLTDEEVNEARENALGILEKKYQAELR